MKLAVIGAGALGAVYGVRLAVRGGVDVVFVVRPSRALSKEPIVIERARGGLREKLDSPARSDHVPGDADVVLVAVGVEDLDALAIPTSDAPVVVLTPMFPKAWARLRDRFGDRAYAAMPNVVAYTRKEDGVIRYWTPPSGTRIDEPRGGPRDAADVVRELAKVLTRAGLRGRLELGVHETNPATTACFISIAMILSLAGSVEALRTNDALLELATRASRDGVRLAHRLGEPVPGAVLAPALAAPWALRAWLGMLDRVSPEARFYAEEHFGRKLRTQHRVMIELMIELARERGLPHASFVEISERFAAQRG